MSDKSKRGVLFMTFRPSQRTLFMARRNWVPLALSNQAQSGKLAVFRDLDEDRGYARSYGNWRNNIAIYRDL